jgi:hypothetical protein
MTTFDDRERAYEAHFAHDEEMAFKAEMRRDRLLGLWAGERMGLTGEALAEYAASIVRVDLREPGDKDVFQKVLADLAENGVEVLPHELRARMDELLIAARAEVLEGN